MKCEFCGEELSPGALACPRCGGPVSKPAGPPPGEGQAPGASQAPAGAPVKVPDPPLAKLEEDFFALAEETVTDEAGLDAARPPDPFVPASAQSIAAIVDQSIPPGAAIAVEQNVLGNELTGGYKGPGMSSVAGAGVQTADDPFGLNVTDAKPGDNLPPIHRHWRYSRWWNLTMLTIGIVILACGVFAAVYFGMIKKSGPSGGSAAAAVNDYIAATLTQNQARLAQVSAPGSKFGSDLNTLLAGYQKYGFLSLQTCDVKTVSISADAATVEISKLDVEIDHPNGTKEIVPVLDITQPYKLPTTVQLVRQNGQWVVKS